MPLIIAIVALALAVLLVLYSRRTTRYINQLRTDLEELEQRMTSAERALAQQR